MSPPARRRTPDRRGAGLGGAAGNRRRGAGRAPNGGETARGHRGPRRPGPAAGDRGRHGLGGDQVEGRRAVRELLAAGRRPVHEVWMADDLEPSPLLDEIERLAAAATPAPRR